MIAPKVICVSFLALALAGCVSTSDDGPKVASAPAPVVSTSPVLGVTAGYANAPLDETDKQRAYAAEVQALEYGGPGSPVAGRGQRCLRHGHCRPPRMPGRAIPSAAITHIPFMCRVDPLTTRGVACRAADGTWGAPS